VGRMAGTVYTRTRELFTMERNHIVENLK
jgi:hypothetical protein